MQQRKSPLSSYQLKSHSKGITKQSSSQRRSSGSKHQSRTNSLDKDSEWEQEAIGFGPFWSEYDMWI